MKKTLIYITLLTFLSLAQALFDNIDLNVTRSNYSIKITGSSKTQKLGHSVSSAGDINGDGLSDFILGTANDDWNGPDSAIAYVIYGKDNGLLDIDLDNFTKSQGFRVLGSDKEEERVINGIVSGLGDINGDGIDDIAVGAKILPSKGNIHNGSAYVIFGKQSGLSDINIGTIDNTKGFKITGTGAYENFAQNVSGAGDINGDGIDDIVISTLKSKISDDWDAFVIFGSKDKSKDIDVATMSDKEGFKIKSSYKDVLPFLIVNKGGDFNGDGLEDIIIGDCGSSGSAFIVFGRNKPSDIDLGSFNTTSQGIKITGAADGNGVFPSSISGAGDVNGDEIDDIIIGAYQTSPEERLGAGTAYVIFGSKTGLLTEIDVSAITTLQGFKIFGEKEGEKLGYVVGPAGDINKDGIGDILVGAIQDPTVTVGRKGAVYVIYGSKSGLYDIDLRDYEFDSQQLFKIDGTGEGFGTSVSAIGDIDGDGINDLLIGAPEAFAHEKSDVGAAYIVLSSKLPPVKPEEVSGSLLFVAMMCVLGLFILLGTLQVFRHLLKPPKLVPYAEVPEELEVNTNY